MGSTTVQVLDMVVIRNGSTTVQVLDMVVIRNGSTTTVQVLERVSTRVVVVVVEFSL